MNAGMDALLIENLKVLKLSAMKRELERHLRQAKQDKLGYDEFLVTIQRKRLKNLNFSKKVLDMVFG